MNGCLESQFDLQKIKIEKGGSGVIIDFKVTGGDSIPTISHSVENPQFPHPDMLNAIDELKDFLIKAVGKETIHSEKIIAGFKGKFKKETEFAELENAIEEHIKGERTKITVTGVAISGYESNRGAIITGTYLCRNGSKIALNSPRIRFEGEMFGFEGELSEIVQVIQSEAYQYTFKDKQAQQQIVFGEEETEKK
jgi:hypothetical protein